jgi:hypothetical protein
MLYVLLVSALVAIGGNALEEVCRVGRRPIRFVWLGALLTTVTLAGLAPLRTVLTESPQPISGLAIPRTATANTAAAEVRVDPSYSVTGKSTCAPFAPTRSSASR